MKVHDSSSIIIASISVVLHGSLAVMSAVQAFQFWKAIKGLINGGGYVWAKFVFFVVMGVSSMLELPLYLGCVVNGGPYGCVWDEDGTHNLAWCCHAMATCGYMYTVISTAILWSDIVQHKDGNFLFSTSPLDNTKMYFRIAFFVYCCIVLVTMIAVMIEECAHRDTDSHAHSREVGAISYCLVPTMLVAITAGCFVSGVKLQYFVVQVQLANPTLRTVLFNLNVTMFVICSSYAMRAVLVLSLWAPMPAGYTDQFQPTHHYNVWVPLVQWFPYWFCSLCLIEQMRLRPPERRKESTVKKGGALELGSCGEGQERDRIESTDSRSSTSTTGSNLLSLDFTGRSLSYLMTQLEESVGDARGSVTSVNFFDQQSGYAAGELRKSRDDSLSETHTTTSALHANSSAVSDLSVA